MQSKAKTVAQYLAELPDDRRAIVEAVRQVILKHLPKGYEEGMQYGMIGYFVPHSLYPAGYHCDPRQPLPFAGLAAQKNYYALYLMCIYSDPQQLEKFQQAWIERGYKLDMGKSCIRFKSLAQVPLDVVGTAIRRVPVKKFIAGYEAATGARLRTSKSTRPPAAAKRTARSVPRRTAPRASR